MPRLRQSKQSGQALLVAASPGSSRRKSPSTVPAATDGALCGFGGLGVVGRNGPTSSTTITGTDAEGSDCAREVSLSVVL